MFNPENTKRNYPPPTAAIGNHAEPTEGRGYPAVHKLTPALATLFPDVPWLADLLRHCGRANVEGHSPALGSKCCYGTRAPVMDSTTDAALMELAHGITAFLAGHFALSLAVLECATRLAEGCANARCSAVARVLMSKCATCAGNHDVAKVHERYGTALMQELVAARPELRVAAKGLLDALGSGHPAATSQ